MSACSRQQTARLLSSPGLEHDQAQAALAAGLSSTTLESPGSLLDEASLQLFGTAELDVADQAEALADVLTNDLCLCPDRDDHRALLIDHALTRRRAHPLQIAVIGHELARRAGISSVIAIFESQPWTVVRGAGGMALVGPGSVQGRPVAPEIRPRCPHQIARQVLLAVRAQGPPERAHRASRLLRVLPVQGCARAALDRED
jgi:Transglutaminase-like superfamily